MFGEKVYVPAILGASGVTPEQAKTCFYYAIATHLLPDEVDRMPILAIVGPQGTGKTSLLEQLSEMVKKPKHVAASSTATLRDNLIGCVTALIDEGDHVHEEYLIKRYDRKTARISYKQPYRGGWTTKNKKFFGATVIVRRTPFSDAATSSRSITIRTTYKYKEDKYRHREFKDVKARLRRVARKVDLSELQGSANRIADNWAVLQAIAEYLGDKAWLKYSRREVEMGIRSLRGGQNYEPDIAILRILKVRMIKLVSDGQVALAGDVDVSDIRDDLKSRFDLPLKNVQIEEICQSLGFKTARPSGYPKVKCNRALLERLCEERGL